MGPRLPSDPTRQAVHGWLLTVVGPIVGIALDVFLAAVVESTNWVAYGAASALILGLPFGQARKDDEDDS